MQEKVMDGGLFLSEPPTTIQRTCRNSSQVNFQIMKDTANQKIAYQSANHYGLLGEIRGANRFKNLRLNIAEIEREHAEMLQSHRISQNQNIKQ